MKTYHAGFTVTCYGLPVLDRWSEDRTINKKEKKIEEEKRKEKRNKRKLKKAKEGNRTEAKKTRLPFFIP